MRNTKPHKQKGRIKMKATKDTVEIVFYHFHADIQNKKLFVPKQVIEKAHDLSSVEARLYFERLHRYPGFEVIAK